MRRAIPYILGIAVGILILVLGVQSRDDMISLLTPEYEIRSVSNEGNWNPVDFNDRIVALTDAGWEITAVGHDGCCNVWVDLRREKSN